MLTQTVKYLRKRSKYNASPTFLDNKNFSSKAESDRYLQLKCYERIGDIRELICQPKYLLQEKFTDKAGETYRPIYYIADFEYFDIKSGCLITEDVKGVVTKEYAIKKKLFIKKYIERENNRVFREIKNR